MKCQSCGKEIANDSKFCEFCGAEVKKSQKGGTSTVETKESRKWIYVTFAVILISLFGYVLYEHSKLNHALDTVRIYREEVSMNEKIIDSLQNVISQTDDKILLVSDDNFGDFDSISFNHLVIIDYYGKWCEPCRRLDPALYEVVKEYHGQLVVGRYIVDDFKEKYVKRYNVTGIPTLLFLLNGREVNRIVGYCEKQAIKDAINSALQFEKSRPVAESQKIDSKEEHFDANEEARKRAEAEKKEAEQEQKKAERKKAEEKKKIRELEKRKYIEQGYVDLGLPSGTLWKPHHEDGFYTYQEAVNRFGKSLPTISQLWELSEKCKWTLDTKSSQYRYLVKGPNGNTIWIPLMGYKEISTGKVCMYNDAGHLWSSTSKDSEQAYYLKIFNDDYRCRNLGQKLESGFYVRLAVQP